MSTTTQRPTPMTDKMEASLARSSNVTRYYNALAQMRLMEVERDEALAKLSTVYRWIERNHPDGFIDSQSHVQNLDRVADAWHDKLQAMRDERNQLSRDLSSLLAGDCLNGHDAVEGTRNGIAMREAIKEAHGAICDLRLHVSEDCDQSLANLALAKLQPFLKP